MVVAEIWKYRGFILSSVKREFASRYLNSLLGAFWSIAGPLAMILMYTLIFSQLMRTKLPGVDQEFGYSIFLCAGMLTWGFFSDALMKSLNVFVDNANLIKKIKFPKVCLPVIVLANSAISFLIIFLIFLMVLIMVGAFPGLKLLALIPLLLVQVMLSIGVGLSFGVINVFFRDVGHVFNIGMQFLFWCTPIVYPISVLPDSLQTFIRCNPLTPLVVAYQDVLVKNVWPDWQTLWWPVLCALIFISSALHLYRIFSGEMVDEL